MSCCGEKRALLRTQSGTGRASGVAGAAPAAAGRPGVGIAGRAALRYLGSGSVALRGLGTGNVYYFAAGSDASPVDERDLGAFLRTGLFAVDSR